MMIESEQEYRDAYNFLDWARAVFKSGWPRGTTAFLNALDNQVSRYEREQFPKATPAGVETVCQLCDHIHTGPIMPWPGEEDERPRRGRSCMYCGCKVRL